jgi:hypothetical protein
VIALTQQIANQNVAYGIRANVILPGLMDTPMAVDTRARTWGKPREEIAAARDAEVPLRHKMGTAWDVANAALFLASDEANFITGVVLPVDGGPVCGWDDLSGSASPRYPPALSRYCTISNLTQRLDLPTVRVTRPTMPFASGTPHPQVIPKYTRP